MWQALLAVAYKEFVQVTRTRAPLKRFFTLQIYSFVMLAWLNLTIRNLPTVIVDQDHSAESREIVQRIVATHSFDVKYATTSTDQAREHLRGGRARVAIVIPPDFARARSSGGSGRLLVLVDGSDSIASSQAVASINGVANRINVELQEQTIEAAPALSFHSVLLFNPQGRTSSFLLPAMLVVGMGNGYSSNAMRRLVAERMGGHLERLLMTPISYVGVLIGKLVPWFFIAMLHVTIFLLIARWGFDVPIRGSLPLLYGAAALYALTILSLGSCIAAGAKDMRQANTLWSISVFPAVFLSGYIYPLSSLPKWLLPIAYLIPQTHFIEIMRGVCLRGATAAELAPDLVYLLIAPIVLSVAGAIRFSRSILD